MKPIALLAAGAVSAQGEGALAYAVGDAFEPARSSVALDPELEALGLRRPRAARVKLADLATTQDRAQALLTVAARGLKAELDRKLPGWRQRRLGLALGTSGGGLPSLERFLTLRAQGGEIKSELARASFYFGPLSALERELGVTFVERSLLLAACASSTVALGLGTRWLEAGRAELVIAGGFDALTPFIAAGFEALGATALELPAPFRVARQGMSLGEGAALCALAPAGDFEASPLGYVLGFAVSSDAVHVTAPDRTGQSLARAATQALADAGLSPAEVDIVSAH
ncbi:MAG TPA: beta-ketoacyl synthase N-terminal-like domain-containing protein, partial [Polyangiaceae bacterium]|nr:beta-ketoacyl synthase N-terminal-like domain-containing protein [Polyangiaceae bacterium]